MGSSGSKPRKPQQRLPKVGSPANMEYQRRARREEHFGRVPLWIALLAILALMIGFLAVTL